MYAKKISPPLIDKKHIYFFTIKNILFSTTKNGADSSVIIFSIRQTAIANELKAREYLEKLRTEISYNQRKRICKSFCYGILNSNPIPFEFVRTG